MKSAKVIFNGKSAIEHNINNVIMSNKPCDCGNPMNVPLIARVLGIVTDCAHCGKDYPMEHHCAAVTESYLELIEDGGIVDLDS